MGLGDDLMWCGEAAKQHQVTGKRVEPTGSKEFSPFWHNLEWIIHPEYNPPYPGEDVIQVPTHPNNGCRWYMDSWGPNKINFTEYEPLRGHIRFSMTERLWSNSIVKDWNCKGDKFVLVNPDSKNTTSANNKAWPFDYWQTLVDRISEHVQVVRLKPASGQDVSGHVEYNQPELKNCINVSYPLRIAMAIARHASCIVTTEGGLHHVAASLGVPCIVLYGAFISPKQTGYKDQVNLYTGPEEGPYGSTVPDDRCTEAMKKITPEEVYTNLSRIITEF